LLRVEGAAVFLLDFGSVWKKDLKDPPEMWSVVFHPQPDAGLLGEVTRTRRPVIVSDLAEEPRYLAATDGIAGLELRNLICVPLVARDQRLWRAISGLARCLSRTSRAGALTTAISSSSLRWRPLSPMPTTRRG